MASWIRMVWSSALVAAPLWTGVETGVAQVPPATINECTLLREPLALRDCIDRAENQRPQPPTEEAGRPRPARDGLLKEARPIAGRSGPATAKARPARGDRVRVEQLPAAAGRRVDPP